MKFNFAHAGLVARVDGRPYRINPTDTGAFELKVNAEPVGEYDSIEAAIQAAQEYEKQPWPRFELVKDDDQVFLKVRTSPVVVHNIVRPHGAKLYELHYGNVFGYRTFAKLENAVNNLLPVDQHWPDLGLELQLVDDVPRLVASNGCQIRRGGDEFSLWFPKNGLSCGKSVLSYAKTVPSLPEAIKWVVEQNEVEPVKYRFFSVGDISYLNVGEKFKLRRANKESDRVQVVQKLHYWTRTETFPTIDEAVNFILTSYKCKETWPAAGFKFGEYEGKPCIVAENGCHIRPLIRKHDKEAKKYEVWVPVKGGAWQYLRAATGSSLMNAVRWVAKWQKEEAAAPRFELKEGFLSVDDWRINKDSKGFHRTYRVRDDGLIFRTHFSTLTDAVNDILPAEHHWPKSDLELGKHEGQTRIIAPDGSRIAPNSSGQFIVFVPNGGNPLHYLEEFITTDLREAVEFLANRQKDKNPRVVRVFSMSEGSTKGVYSTWLSKDTEILRISGLAAQHLHVEFLAPRSFSPEKRFEFVAVDCMDPVPDGARYLGTTVTEGDRKHIFLLAGEGDENAEV